jgi:hypothetical protein
LIKKNGALAFGALTFGALALRAMMPPDGGPADHPLRSAPSSVT